MAPQAGAYPGFRSMKRLGVFLVPPLPRGPSLRFLGQGLAGTKSAPLPQGSKFGKRVELVLLFASFNLKFEGKDRSSSEIMSALIIV